MHVHPAPESRSSLELEFLFIAVSAFAPVCWAQSNAAATPAVPLSPDTQPWAGINFQGSYRTRVEVWNWFQPDTGNNQYAFSGNVLRLSALKTTSNWDWQVEFELPFLLWLPANSVGPGAQGQLGLGGTYYVSNSNSLYSAMIFFQAGLLTLEESRGSCRTELAIGRLQAFTR